MTFEGKHNDLTEKAIEAFYAVYNQLGYGFSEKIYENALAIEFMNQGLNFVQQAPVQVYYHGSLVGE